MNTQNIAEVRCELTATYISSSRWTLDFDLKDVHDWYVKWETLYVKHQENDEDYVEYEPEYSAYDSDALKRPASLWIGDEEA